MFTLLSLWAALLAGPIHGLSSPEYSVRQICQARLQNLGPLALPGLLSVWDSSDPEQRGRARRLLEPYRLQGQQYGYDVLAWWLFYGPDDDEHCGRCLNDHNTAWTQTLAPASLAQLAERALSWMLLQPWEADHANGSAALWINIARHRAHGYPELPLD